ncbi:Na(+)/H(+) antiporter subunit B [Metabacillus iocasae]|uniref:Multicomponent Na+:H+ antiporter subunit B n=1 Tax=Priestia iocasae TaxID=2291674 RepID=A0ABS2QYS8_9BACI|nr:Na(+)/H(+) antiporter subunit B [Metabacillus iocasae]MBM7704649.1 multicomponent Na+:H+ antiporter subunit B [Metabacillus iocasae]
MKPNDLILQTVTKVVAFIIAIFAVYLFFAGHYTPGGGFVGGLMASAALVLLLLSFDIKTVQEVIPVNFRTIIAIGLLIAVVPGLFSFFFGVPFLTHTFGYFNLPIIGKTALATVTLFEVGVFLVVVGFTMTVIQTIGESE